MKSITIGNENQRYVENALGYVLRQLPYHSIPHTRRKPEESHSSSGSVCNKTEQILREFNISYTNIGVI